MPIRDLKTQIGRLPEQPGVYLYLNAAGDTIYVGKARALRDRVRSYLGAYGVNPKTDALLDEADRLEVIVTDSVVEALALENNLIKQRAPKYNILLRDDKSYPYLQLTTGEAFPRVLVARRVERDGHTYAARSCPPRFARKTMALTIASSASGRATRSSPASAHVHASSTTSTGASPRASTPSALKRSISTPCRTPGSSSRAGATS